MKENDNKVKLVLEVEGIIQHEVEVLNYPGDIKRQADWWHKYYALWNRNFKIYYELSSSMQTVVKEGVKAA